MDSPESALGTANAPGFYRHSLVVDGLVAAPPSGRFVQELIGAGVSACNWTVAGHADETLSAINRLTQFYWLLEQRPDITLLVDQSGDILRAKKENKLGIVLGFQGATPLGRNVHYISVFRRLGIRIIQLTYNEGNAFAAGCAEPSNAGLTSLGIQAVREMNRCGVVLDLSHAGARASLEAIELSRHPVIFSHSNPRALQENPRNTPATRCAPARPKAVWSAWPPSRPS